MKYYLQPYKGINKYYLSKAHFLKLIDNYLLRSLAQAKIKACIGLDMELIWREYRLKSTIGLISDSKSWNKRNTLLKYLEIKKS